MYENLIRRLRETESRSKRALLDEVVQAIADLSEWRDFSVEVPAEDGTVCNVVVNGKYEDVCFLYAICQATWYKDEGWVLEAYPAFKGFEVTHWMPVPPLPGEVRE